MPTGAFVSPETTATLAAREGAMLPALAPTSGTRMQLLVDQGEVLPPLLDSVRGARSSIDFSMFSLADSGAGKEMVDALVDRARDGVRVRVTMDQVGSMLFPVGSAARMVDRLRESGAEVAVNKRLTSEGVEPVDHRKLLVVDGATAYTGGMNLSSKFGKWHDVMVRLDGPAAAQLGAQFLDRWTDLTVDVARGTQPAASANEALWRTNPGSLVAVRQARDAVGLLVNDPRGELQASEHLMENLKRAKDRAWIMTPTLSDPGVVDALTRAAKRGVDVRVAVSGPEGWIGTRALGLIGSTFYGDLVGAGVKVYEQPGMSHAKVSLVDEIASAGSLNMTRRAMLWDHELMVASNARSFVHEVEHLFQHDMSVSTLVTAEHANRPVARIGAAVRRATGLKW